MVADTHNYASRPEAEVVADLALRVGEPHAVDRDSLYAVLVPPGHTVQEIDHREDADNPRRRQGTTTLHDGPSFAQYVTTQSGPGTRLYVDVDAATFVAVLNDHGHYAGGDLPGWGDHRARLRLKPTPEWQRWTANDRKPLDQIAFAEFIEESAGELIEPEAAVMLNIAQTFQSKTQVTFKSANWLQNGQRELTWHEDVQAGAGTDGKEQVPQSLRIAMHPFVGGAPEHPFAMTARMRYKVRDGKLTLTYLMDHPERVIEAAVKDVREQIETDTGLPVWAGVPAA